MLQQYKTQGGISIEFTQQPLEYHQGLETLLEQLNSQRGALFTSSFEYPGRYTCWDIGFYNPPLVISCKQGKVFIEALNQRGLVLLAACLAALESNESLAVHHHTEFLCEITIKPSERVFSEEERSQQPSVFTAIRLILALFKSDEDSYLGLYGAFGFDLIYQFEQLPQVKQRELEQRDMVLFLPDEIYVVNHRKEEAFVRRYDLHFQGQSTQALPRDGEHDPYLAVTSPEIECDHAFGEYANVVKLAKERFACGDLFEVVTSQTFYRHFTNQPSELFKQMREVNPSPYGFIINLGEHEYLVGASPEMYVRVQGSRVETCPISGTIKRGDNAIEDAKNIQLLLDSKKEESELTMCTDVDRNDKSRICVAGSVQVIGRRQIEMYSRLIHTVDHVEGVLRDGFDAIDAFLTHMWVVTVTGAPKLWALNFIEQHEKSPRKWYGGAVGWLGFDGNLNTGLVLRTVRIDKGIAEVRVGATLLFDSTPEAEEQETRLKASAFLDVIQNVGGTHSRKADTTPLPGAGKKVVLIDHQDSFVHTLANYLRQTGAEVSTIRFDRAIRYLDTHPVDLVVLSPGPGRPSDFKLADTIGYLINKKLPIFGVCLGLQGLVEYFGGDLDILDYPMHGKPSQVNVLESEGLFSGLGPQFEAGRYHSLHARRSTFPNALKVTAETEDKVVMGIAHQELPIYAVQFHPETILSLPNQAGITIIRNLMKMLSVSYI